MNKKELNKAFIKACESGVLSSAEYYVKYHGHDLNLNDGLILLCQKHQNSELSDIRKILTSKKIDMRGYVDEFFDSACLNGNIEAVKYLLSSPELKQHADVQNNMYQGFRNACQYGHLDIVKYLLTSTTLKDDDSSLFEKFGLGFACLKGHLDVVKYLLSSNADIHAWSDDCFAYACDNEHLDVVDFLLHHESFLSDRLELCIEELGEQRVFEIIATLKPEQQNYFYEKNKEFFDEHLDDLFPLYLAYDTSLPDALDKGREAQEEIDIII